MQVSAPERDQLRRLAELRLDRPVVLSLYLDLDPSEFATPPARATAVRSLLDEADRRVREHDEPAARGPRRPAGDAEARVGLPRAQPADRGRARRRRCSRASRRSCSRRSSCRARSATGWRSAARRWWGRWPASSAASAGASRSSAAATRASSAARPTACARSSRSTTPSSASTTSGGLSQARFARGIEKEKDDHLKNTGEALLRHFKLRPFQRLLLGGPARGGQGLRGQAARLPARPRGGAHRRGRGRRDAGERPRGRAPDLRRGRARARGAHARAGRRAGRDRDRGRSSPP